ncbi:uncharacterized protein KD926_010000 [Aspergillus affinis]|uniref:uncharacterized protein n=1 Tax=Aspergillus affinis TaxID=1070780 RepID=UPI0022FE3768|nr:uncharacterized protein KD926_010000 [Aspergillus affinis]KAI9039016.1 hypothetical protein KD926_010000 [Aspergillus affinis]
MPPLQGEERMLTVFADIHYYFTAPTPKPLHHRFDKGSYLYLYYNATHHKIRIEVANNPGAPEQDSFNGALDRVHVRHSTRFPTLCTLTVDGQVQSQGQQAFPPPPCTSTSAYEWLLPNGDPREKSDDLLLLHTLDIYFWTSDDATQFLDLTERCLSRSQIETDRRPFPPPPQTTATSTVVQQLESVAITDPAYQNGQTRNSQSEATVASPFQSMIPPGALPPPPPLNGPPSSNAGRGPSIDEQKDPAQFTPLPYNPAAPAAPEPIQHREKTPPPADGADGTGLAAAVAADNGVPYSPPSLLSGAGNFASPPPATQGLPFSMPGSYASPPPSAGLTHSGSFSSRSSIQSPPGVPSYTPSFVASANQAVNAPPVQTMSFAPPPKDPNTHLYGQTQNMYASHPHTQPTSPPPPVGGYSNYSYDPAPRRQSTNSEYDIHKQFYRPTEAEATSHAQKYTHQAMQNPGQRPRKLEENASRVESGVNRFLKKLEKKL